MKRLHVTEAADLIRQHDALREWQNMVSHTTGLVVQFSFGGDAIISSDDLDRKGIPYQAVRDIVQRVIDDLVEQRLAAIYTRLVELGVEP